MKKVILVQPENGLNEAVYVPLGLISLASFVRKDFEVQIIDLRFESLDYLYDQVKTTKPLAVGFSMLTGNCITQIINAAREIKSHDPKVKIIVGGIHPTFFPEQTLVNPYIDFVIVREGEKTLLSLLKALESKANLSGIDNLGWKDKRGKGHLIEKAEDFLNLDELPTPAWDLIDVERYINKLSNASSKLFISGESGPQRTINMYTSKGCPFICSFCYNLNFNRHQWRYKSPEKAVDEIEMLNKKYGINYFIIHDDNFVVNRQRALKIAELIKARGLKIKYSIDARIDYFDYDFLRQMKESGLCEIRVGCESGSNRVLKDVIRKGITKEQTIKAVEIAKRLDLKLLLSFVIGWPTETVAERQKTIDLILKLQKIHPPAGIYPLWVYLPYPGTSLFNLAVELGFKQPESLEEWGSYFWGKAHIPWLRKPREYEIIHELSPLAWNNRTWQTLPNRSSRELLKFGFTKVVRPLILFRFRNNFWRFPVDARMIVGLKSLMSSKKAI
jgi:radical SAM superfamily enzyme YgiQ (UPF0313 family)